MDNNEFQTNLYFMVIVELYEKIIYVGSESIYRNQKSYFQ